MEPSNRTISELIGLIYDCALGHESWEEALGRIAAALDSQMAILSLNDLRRERVVLARSVGWSSRSLQQREHHLPEIHARLSGWLALRGSIKEPFVASRDIPSGELASSRYVCECLQPLGVVDIAHFFLLSTHEHFSELVIAWRAEHGPVRSSEIELAMLLLPHLRRAVTISRLLDADSAASEDGRTTVESGRLGIVLVDRHARVMHVDRAAERLLRHGTQLRIEAEMLRLPDPGAELQLRRAIAMAINENGAAGRAGLAIRLGGQAQIVLRVLPMASVPPHVHHARDVAIAICIETPVAEHARASQLADRFGLTPAERRVVWSLMTGRTLNETARDMGIARSTAKTHLSHIFQKTGSARQADLLRIAIQIDLPF